MRLHGWEESCLPHVAPELPPRNRLLASRHRLAVCIHVLAMHQNNSQARTRHGHTASPKCIQQKQNENGDLEGVGGRDEAVAKGVALDDSAHQDGLPVWCVLLRATLVNIVAALSCV